MAAFMLVGAKLGDIWGRDRAFAIGLAVYGAGSLTTAIAPNLTVLLFGWSLVEGLGAVLVVPAIAALVAANYEGKERALAYALIGGVAAAAVAAGPLIGGWVTTNYTWRLVFVGEVVIVAVILLFRRRMQPAPRAERVPQLDVVGATLSAIGLALIVFGILQSSTWGWVQPNNPPIINGEPFTPLGFSPVLFMILGGLGFLAAMATWEERRERLGKDALVDLSMLGIARLRAGLTTLGGQQLVLMGTFFVLPVYLQTVLGLDAFETGLKLFPLSISMLIAALLGPRMAARRSPKRVAQVGLIFLALGRDTAGRDGGRGAERDRLRRRPRRLRHRCRPPGVAARQRHPLVGRPDAEQRGGRAPGHRPEPRRLARYGAHRRHPADRPDHGLRRTGRGEPRPAARGQRGRDRGGRREGRRHRPGRSRPRRSWSRPACRRTRRPSWPPTTATRSSTG